MSFWAQQFRFLIAAALIIGCKVQVIDRTEELNGRTGGAGTNTETEETTATIDGTPTIDINNGATFTTSLSVTLTLNFSDVTEMYITNTADCTDGGSWETYATSKAWTLATSDAKNTVYVKFKNADGAESKCVSDTIIHDGTAPTESTNLNDGTASASLISTPSISWNEANDAGSGISHYKIALGTTSGGTDTKSWTKIGNVTETTLNGISLERNTNYYVSLIAVDEAGLESSVATSDGFRVFGTWVLEAAMTASNGESGDAFGYSLAAASDTLVVGAAFEDSNQTTITNGNTASSDNSISFSGAAYAYKRTGTQWSQEAYLKPPNPTSLALYGCAADMDSHTMVVGAMWEASNQTTITNGTTASSDESNIDSGAAYVYTRSGTQWSQQAYLKAANNHNNWNYGLSVAIDGDTIAVGAEAEAGNQSTITNGTTATSTFGTTVAGAVYVYTRSGTNWAQQAYVKAANNQGSLRFGTAVDLSGDTLVVGALDDDSNQTTITNGTTASSDTSVSKAGAAYVYTRTGTQWSPQAYLKPPLVSTDLQYGSWVAVHGNTIAIGAKEDSNQTTITNGSTAPSDTSSADSGAVYIYKRTGTTWAQEAFIKTSNSDAGDGSTRVALYQNRLVVAASGEDSNQTTISVGAEASSDNSSTDSGAVYVFERLGTTWNQTAYIKAENTTDTLGAAISLDAERIYVSGKVNGEEGVRIYRYEGD